MFCNEDRVKQWAMEVCVSREGYVASEVFDLRREVNALKALLGVHAENGEPIVMVKLPKKPL